MSYVTCLIRGATCEKMTKVDFRFKGVTEPILTKIKLVPQLLVLVDNIKFYGNSINITCLRKLRWQMLITFVTAVYDTA
jgi:hypothetical protein